MKKLIVLAILFCISIPLMSAENSEDKITFDFIYSSLKGFNVTKCRIFYPENSFLEEIKAKEGNKIINAKTRPFMPVPKYNSLTMDCININETNPMHIMHEYEKIFFIIPKKPGFLSKIPLNLLIMINIILFAIFIFVDRHKTIQSKSL